MSGEDGETVRDRPIAPSPSHRLTVLRFHGSSHGYSSAWARRAPGRARRARFWAQALGLPKFATGDLLRDAVKRGTPLGQQAKAVMEAGHLVGDDIILGVVREEVGSPRPPRA